MLSAFRRIKPRVQLRVRFITKWNVEAPTTGVKQFSGVVNENAAMPFEESPLVTQTDSSTILKKIFNPFVLRTYGELRPELDQPALYNFRSTADNILKSAVLTLGPERGNMNTHTNSVVSRYDIAQHLFDTMRSLRSDKEQQYVASVLAITIPASERMWKEYDQGMVKLLNIDKVCSIDTGLLAFHAMFSSATSTRSTGTKKWKIATYWKTPSALMNMIVRRRKQLIQEKRQANVFDFAEQCIQLAPMKENPPTNVEVNSEVEGALTRDSKELERLGLIMQLLATPSLSTPKTPQERTDYNLVGLEATEYGVKVLTTLKGPAPISALKVVWTHSPKCKLPNSYMFNKSLFEQVLRSLTADPRQLVGEEEDVLYLLQSMAAVKFKSSALTAILFDIYSQRDFDFEKFGLKLFESLVALNALSFASSVLNSWVDSSEARFDELTDGSKEVLWIVVTNCGRVDHKNMEHQKVMRDVEVAMTKEIANLPLQKVLALLRIYARAGRNYPPIVEQLCEVVNQNVNTMSAPSLIDALWAAARLNLRNASFVDAAVARVLGKVTEMYNLNSSKDVEVTRLLWSMSVLRKLDLETFAAATAVLEQQVSTDLTPLSQVWAEVQTLFREQGIDQKDWLLKNIDKNRDGEVLNEHVRMLPWYSDKVSISNADSITSSRKHLDLSKTLTRMGVLHENEVPLSNGYVADIFIPIESLEEISRSEADRATEGASLLDCEVIERHSDAEDYEVSLKDCKGVVVEFDGPFHFESYKREELGHTVMKRRHIKNAGYKMVNIPFWHYGTGFTTDKQEQVVKTYLQKMGLRIKREKEWTQTEIP
eukprot:gene9256-10914_t